MGLAAISCSAFPGEAMGEMAMLHMNAGEAFLEQFSKVSPPRIFSVTSLCLLFYKIQKGLQ